jgi:hypothetical protein
VTGAELSWPGVDRQRAVGACWHLHRAAELLVELARYADESPRLSWRVRAAGEHARIARGFLGAIGFEHGAGLYRPSARPRQRP